MYSCRTVHGYSALGFASLYCMTHMHSAVPYMLSFSVRLSQVGVV